MFNNYIPSDNYISQKNALPQGALEIAVRARKQEKELALMNEVIKAETPVQPKSRSNPLRSLVVSFFALVR